MIRYHIDEVMYFKYPDSGGETHGLRVRGWAFDGDSDRPLTYGVRFGGGERIPVEPIRFPRHDVTELLENADNAGDCGFIARVDCPDGAVPGKFELEASNGIESKTIKAVPGDILGQICLRQPVIFKVEKEKIEDGDILIEGWAFSLDGQDVSFEVTGLGGRKIPARLDRFNKTKLYKLGFIGERNNFAGFRIRFASNRFDHYRLRMFTANGGEIYGCSRKSIAQAEAESAEATTAISYDSWYHARAQEGWPAFDSENLSDRAPDLTVALEKLHDDYQLITQAGDESVPKALNVYAAAIAAEPDAAVIYADEDRIGITEERYADPWFKPDYDLDLLRSVNYIGTTFCVRRDLLEEIAAEAGIDKDSMAGNPYDLLLRCAEKTDHFLHIPRVLVHKNSDQPVSSGSARTGSGKKELEEHFMRLGIDAKVEANPNVEGAFRVSYPLEDEPLISVIIPNKDNTDVLDVCLKSLIKTSIYRNLEIIVIENNSTEPKTFTYYDKIKKRYDNVRVIRYEEEGFNYAALNNAAARKAHGDLLLFLNNDTKIIDPDAVRVMAANCMRPGVGAAGAKLLYPDKTIQHAGILFGFAGFCRHNHLLEPEHSDRFHGYVDLQRSVSAVTGACMMVRRELFEEVGGFDEIFAVSCNDIDLCLKIRQSGNRIVYIPTARFFHFESKSRGREDTRAKAERFEYEKAVLITRWEDAFMRGDPYYNPNLALFGKEYEPKGERDDEMYAYAIGEKKEYLDYV